MLKILKLIEMLSGNINTWSQKKIMLYRPMSKYKMNIVNNFLSISAFVLFLVFAYSLYFPANIQDIEVVQPKEEKKIIITTPEKKEFERLQKHFTWLNEDVYAYMVEQGNRRNVDPILAMAVTQIESGNSCKNDWKCMVKIRGGSGEYGGMQVLGIHADRPSHLKDWKYNTERGMWYLSEAVNFYAAGNAKKGVRLYNQGWHGKRKNYRRWWYPRDVIKIYKKVITEKVMVVKI